MGNSISIKELVSIYQSLNLRRSLNRRHLWKKLLRHSYHGWKCGFSLYGTNSTCSIRSTKSLGNCDFSKVSEEQKELSVPVEGQLHLVVATIQLPKNYSTSPVTGPPIPHWAI